MLRRIRWAIEDATVAVMGALGAAIDLARGYHKAPPHVNPLRT